MKQTSVPALFGTAAFFAAAAWILVRRFYGDMVSIPVTVSLTLWGLAAVCALLTVKVRRALHSDDAPGIGLDNSQLNPMTVTQFMLVGKASAWTGAALGGAYVGMAFVILPHAGELTAAAQDTAGVLSSALGGAAMSAAGVILERHCQAPPPDALLENC